MKQKKSVFDFTVRELSELEPNELSELGDGLEEYISAFMGNTPIELYDKRCKCKEEESLEQKAERKRAYSDREPRPLRYLESDESIVKTFQLRYEKQLSSIAKLVLNSFQNKYIYYAIDDILYSFQSNPSERDNLLAILYSPVLSLQNNFSISFFDIWIDEIYINKISKVNKFLNNTALNLEQCSYITIKLSYKTRMPVKKLDPLW
jgi:hypothetical protein